MIRQQNLANYNRAKARLLELPRCIIRDPNAPSLYSREQSFPTSIIPSKPTMEIEAPAHLQYHDDSRSNTYVDRVYQKVPLQSLYNNQEKPAWDINSLVQHNKGSKSRSKTRSNALKPKTLAFQPVRLKSANYKDGQSSKWENRIEVADKQLYKVLQSKFKIQEFRNNQKAIIKCTMLGNDVFVCMPTGGGKSLTFQVPLTLESGITFCILPLVSLIYDQEMQAQKIGIKAFGLTGATQYEVIKKIYQVIKTCEDSKQGILIFSTPQKLTRSQKLVETLIEIAQRGLFRRIVIDQVHCVSIWGRDFRKDYQNLGILKKLFPKVPILALTATASEQVLIDIINNLSIRNCYFFKSSFNRPNLNYGVLPKKPASILNDILDVIARHQGKSGLIYCSSRKDTEEMADKLIKHNVSAHYYHAQMDDALKKSVQYKWMHDQINIVVATIAFGMGINKPDVRFVIHYSLSKNLQNYYQESGRAGRDGLDSECIIFYRSSDSGTHKYLIINNNYSTQEVKNHNMTKLNEMIAYCQDTITCRRKLQLSYFGEEFDAEMCGKTCDNCRCGTNVSFRDAECFEEAQAILGFILELQEKKQCLTLAQLCAFIQGKNGQLGQKLKFFQKKNITRDRLLIMDDWKADDIKKLIQELISKKYIYESSRKINSFTSSFLATNMSLLCQLQAQGSLTFKIINGPKGRKNKKYKHHQQTDYKEMDKEQGNYQNDDKDQTNSAHFGNYNYNNKANQSNQGEADKDFEQFLRLFQQDKKEEQERVLFQYLQKEFGQT